VPANGPDASVACNCGSCRAALAKSERTLVDAVRGGDERAFGALYDLHAPTVFGLCLRLLNERVPAEGLLEQVFWKLWQTRSLIRCPDDGVLKCLLAYAVRGTLPTVDPSSPAKIRA
jgi:hypothetical protein